MNLGEKIYKLRKEKGMSQETLAEVIGTTRQAISKWENNQGFPETEKLLLLANTFNVTVDYLLKDNEDSTTNDENSYYISKEKAEGYFLYNRKVSRTRSVGLFFIICAIIPCFYLKEDSLEQIFVSAILVIVGMGIFATRNFYENEYKNWKYKVLTFDNNYFSQLKVGYALLKKKFFVVNMVSAVLLLVGLLCCIYVSEISNSATITIEAIGCLLLAISISIFGYVSSERKTYEFLLNNQDYRGRFTVRFRNKVNSKF